MSEQRLIPLKEAQRRLGISKMTMARLVREGHFQIYLNPLDRRQKLVDVSEIVTFSQPQPARPERDPDQPDDSRGTRVDDSRKDT